MTYVEQLKHCLFDEAVELIRDAIATSRSFAKTAVGLGNGGIDALKLGGMQHRLIIERAQFLLSALVAGMSREGNLLTVGCELA
jgi:hypothetical protein